MYWRKWAVCPSQLRGLKIFFFFFAQNWKDIHVAKSVTYTVHICTCWGGTQWKWREKWNQYIYTLYAYSKWFNVIMITKFPHDWFNTSLDSEFCNILNLLYTIIHIWHWLGVTIERWNLSVYICFRTEMLFS